MRGRATAFALLGSFVVGAAYGIVAQHKQLFPHSILKKFQNPAPGVPGDNTYYAESVKQFRALSGGGGGHRVVMIGDSITESGRWHSMFPCDRIYSQGISGDTTSGVLDRLDAVIAAKPKMVVAMIGTNDIAWGHSLDGIVARYATIVRRLSEKVETFLLMETPFVREVDYRNKAIADLNSALRALCASLVTKNCVFVEVNASLAPNNKLEDANTLDGTHLSARAYLKLREILRPYMRQCET